MYKLSLEQRSDENALQLEINFCNILESPYRHLQAIYPRRGGKKLEMLNLEDVWQKLYGPLDNNATGIHWSGPWVFNYIKASVNNYTRNGRRET